MSMQCRSCIGCGQSATLTLPSAPVLEECCTTEFPPAGVCVTGVAQLHRKWRKLSPKLNPAPQHHDATAPAPVMPPALCLNESHATPASATTRTTGASPDGVGGDAAVCCLPCLLRFPRWSLRHGLAGRVCSLCWRLQPVSMFPPSTRTCRKCCVAQVRAVNMLVGGDVPAEPGAEIEPCNSEAAAVELRCLDMRLRGTLFAADPTNGLVLSDAATAEVSGNGLTHGTAHDTLYQCWMVCAALARLYSLPVAVVADGVRSCGGLSLVALAVAWRCAVVWDAWECGCHCLVGASAAHMRTLLGAAATEHACDEFDGCALEATEFDADVLRYACGGRQPAAGTRCSGCNDCGCGGTWLISGPGLRTECVLTGAREHGAPQESAHHSSEEGGTHGSGSSHD